MKVQTEKNGFPPQIGPCEFFIILSPPLPVLRTISRTMTLNSISQDFISLIFLARQRGNFYTRQLRGRKRLPKVAEIGEMSAISKLFQSQYLSKLPINHTTFFYALGEAIREITRWRDSFNPSIEKISRA